MTTNTAKTPRRFARTPSSQVDAAADDAPKPGVAHDEQAPAEQFGSSPAVRPESKVALVTRLLESAEGATLPDLVEATGWLPHTTRAALTGLKKKGKVITKGKRDDVTCYFIAGPAA